MNMLLSLIRKLSSKHERRVGANNCLSGVSLLEFVLAWFGICACIPNFNCRPQDINALYHVV